VPVSHDFPLRTEFDTAPDVAWNGQSWLVVWKSEWTINSVASRVIESALVATTGLSASDDTHIVSRNPGQVDDPAVAWGGGTFLVVWEDVNNGNDSIGGRRVDGNGVAAPLEPFTVADPDASFHPMDPAVTYNGRFLVAWLRAAGGFLTVDLYASRVDADGRSLDLLGFPVSTVQNRGARFNPSVTPGPNGRWDVVYAEGGLPNGGPTGPTTVFWRGVTK
jgi:hypothetical protein